jgi:hypothetical protein
MPKPICPNLHLSDQGGPSYQKNDDLAWIKGAKLESTRKKRLDQMLSELRGGT